MPLPDPKTVECEEYEFDFASGKRLVVTLWPHLGDEATYDKIEKSWTFKYGSHPGIREVHKAYVETNHYTISKRVYLDPKEATKLWRDKQAEDAKSRERAKGHGPANEEVREQVGSGLRATWEEGVE